MDRKPKSGLRVFYAAAMALTVLTLAGVTIWGNSSEPSVGARVASRAEARTFDLPAASPLLVTAPPASPTAVATATPRPPLLTGPPTATPVPAVATIMPSPGVTTNVTIPGTQGSVSIPNDAGGDRTLHVEVKPAPSPTSPPSGLTVLSSIQISFSLDDFSSVRELEQDVTIEISYAGLGLSDSQLDRLVIYNASRDEYLPTTIDRTRQVAIARTRRFSTFTLARITGPIPRNYVPLMSKDYADGW
ncbi:MAG: hypothetical protein Q7R39_14415 [Dehalococcoidia bacterium]|nr:hypothetical protein [Dehalococcoidia bacterium]